MNKRQKADEKRLLASIEHWKRLEKTVPNRDSKEYPGPSQCALCRTYLRNGMCEGCPIKRHTGEDGCVGTPYNDCNEGFFYHMACWDCGEPQKEHSLRLWKEAAGREIRFLQRVLAKVRAGKL